MFIYLAALRDAHAQVQAALRAAGAAMHSSQAQQQQQQQNEERTLLLPAAPGACARSGWPGLRVTGVTKGDALLIWNVLLDGQTPDAAAAHIVCRGGQPVDGVRCAVLC